MPSAIRLISLALTGLSTRVAAWALICALGWGAPALAASDAAPEAASGISARSLVVAKRWMAASANPLATQAGRDILRAGGSAVDAAIAMQMVLSLVEPQSSGVGGGAFILTYEAAQRRVSSFDGRETAPMAAQTSLFMRDGQPLAFSVAMNSGLAVGVPGLLRALELAHRRQGKLPWAQLFQAAIQLAENGFPVSPRLHGQIAGNPALYAQPAARAYFYPNDRAAPIGYVLLNPALAVVFRQIAHSGANAFYEGEIAADMVRAVQTHPVPGSLSLADLKNYSALQRTPVCSAHREFQVCGMGPPSSGGIAVLQMLGLLQQHSISQMPPQGREAAHYFSEAGRLAFADRERYVADPDFISVPVQALLHPRYLAWRGAQMDSRVSLGQALPGDPAGFLQQRGRDNAPDLPATTHLVAVDAQGNGVSMTSSIETEFGSKIFVRGFLLNNQLTDFSLSPQDAQGQWVANRVEPGKRPRSSMAPMIVTEGGKLSLLLGSPGGSAIINFVAKTLVGVLDWGLDVQSAIDLPNIGSRNRETELEQGSAAVALQQDLQALGHRVKILPLTSGIQAIRVGPEGLQGGADSRREGQAAGD